MTSSNGEAKLSAQPGAVAEGVSKLDMTMVMTTGTMQINFAGPNIDVALNMLAQATRYMEAQLRQAQALQLQEKLAERAQAADVARRIGVRR